MERLQERLPGLDGLRGIAAVAVMLYHFNFMLLPSAHFWRIVNTNRAYLSVDLFFVMSGYLLAHVYGAQLSENWRANWKPYLLARVGRIYPLFLLTLAALLAIHAATGVPSKFVSFSAGSLALQPFMLQAMSYGMNWNYPAWSISTEAAAYVLFIFAARPLLRGRYPVMIAGTLVALIAVLCLLKHDRLDVASQAPAYLRTFAGFGIGVLIFRWMTSTPGMVRKIAICAALPLLAAGYFTGSDFVNFCAVVTIVILAVSRTLPMLDWKLFRALGDWSYGVYLWHAPISFALLAAGRELPELETWEARLAMLLVSAFVIAVAAVTYYLVEVPARRWIRQGLYRKEVALKQSAPSA
jgi:peptidoglycan/LPS O-acetylase OafA/YrhL